VNSPFKRLIRSAATRQYLRSDGTWTNDLNEAECFVDTQAAISAVFRLRLSDCELVLMMGPQPSDAYDVVLPLSDAEPRKPTESHPDDSREAPSGKCK
jgi:hypothetical protein